MHFKLNSKINKKFTKFSWKRDFFRVRLNWIFDAHNSNSNWDAFFFFFVIKCISFALLSWKLIFEEEYSKWKIKISICNDSNYSFFTLNWLCFKSRLNTFYLISTKRPNICYRASIDICDRSLCKDYFLADVDNSRLSYSNNSSH